MAGEALLENPALFEGGRVGDRQPQLAREYLQLQREYPTDLKNVKQHVFTMLYAHVQVHTDLRAALHAARTLEDMASIVDQCEERATAAADVGKGGGGHVSAEPQAAEGGVATGRRDVFCCREGAAYTPWYRRHELEAARHSLKLQAEQRHAVDLAHEP